MSQAISAINSPGVLLPSAQSQMTQAMAAAKATTTSGTNAAASTTNIGSTFLNLLSTELQNQDPTAPVDSTAMVGQMISLNQLDQLIAINQTLGATSTSSTPTTTSHSVTAPATSLAATPSAQPAALDPASMLSNPQATLPFDPATMMPIANPIAAQPSINGVK